MWNSSLRKYPEEQERKAREVLARQKAQLETLKKDEAKLRDMKRAQSQAKIH